MARLAWRPGTGPGHGRDGAGQGEQRTNPVAHVGHRGERCLADRDELGEFKVEDPVVAAHQDRDHWVDRPGSEVRMPGPDIEATAEVGYAQSRSQLRVPGAHLSRPRSQLQLNPARIRSGGLGEDQAALAGGPPGVPASAGGDFGQMPLKAIPEPGRARNAVFLRYPASLRPSYRLLTTGECPGPEPSPGA